MTIEPSNEIPNGLYCYGSKYKCPNWVKTDQGAWCNLFKVHSKDGDTDLLWDGVKLPECQSKFPLKVVGE